jgi:hypothetical protein
MPGLRRRVALLTGVLVLGAACSSSGSSTTGASPSSTATTAPAPSTSTSTTFPASPRARYLAAGNAICDTMNQRVGTLPAPGNDRVKAAKNAADTAAIVADALRKLRALPVPPGEQAAVRSIYAKVDRVLHDSSRLATAIRANDQTAAKAAETDLQADSLAANAASNAYGLTVCGS